MPNGKPTAATASASGSKKRTPASNNASVAALKKELAQQKAEHRQESVESARRIEKLEHLVLQLSDLKGFENSVAHGIELLTAQIAPLADLTRKAAPLGKRLEAQLIDLNDAMERPDWSAGGRLPVMSGAPVDFIGAVTAEERIYGRGANMIGSVTP